MKIAFVGHGRHGKDECCRLFSEISGLKNAGTLSAYLLPVVKEYVKTQECQEKFMLSDRGKDETIDYNMRHYHREVWRAAGDWYRREDPATLIKDALAVGPVTGGIRGLEEIREGRKLFDLIVWVERPGTPKDPTMEYGAEEADQVIRNDGTLDDLRATMVCLWWQVHKWNLEWPQTAQRLRGIR